MLDEADKNRVPMFDEMRRNARRACVSSGIVLWVVGACAPASSDDNAVRRGDVAFARDSLEEALAEYRLAARRGDEEPRILARVAHTYLALGRVDEASEAYGRAVEKDTRYADMAAADLVQLAREASRRDDRFLMASAMEQARSFLPELSVPDLTLDLARHHFQSGEYALALPLYQRALSEGADSVPEVVLEIGQAYDESGDCRSALVFFERFRRLASAPNRGSVDFNIGRCQSRLGGLQHRSMLVPEGPGDPAGRATISGRPGRGVEARRTCNRPRRAAQQSGRGLVREGGAPLRPGRVRRSPGGVPAGPVRRISQLGARASGTGAPGPNPLRWRAQGA